mgnify:CR=1 FL=1
MPALYERRTFATLDLGRFRRRGRDRLALDLQRLAGLRETSDG